MYNKHKIHRVDKNHKRIVMKDVDVNDFAVKLKRSETRPAAETFRDETRRHLEHLKGVKCKDVDLSDLINEKARVSLVSGVAGIGKSIFTKQLAMRWASNELYTELKLCIVMECREINNFAANEGASLEKYELLSEFLKKKFEFDLKDGPSTLFIVDGLDELSDINSNDSVIWQLLTITTTKYPNAKIILTGRPHVSGKLERKGEVIGGLQRFEIQGLNDEQIKDYVNKFTPVEEDRVTVNNAIESSKGLLQIISVPEFLNSLCCVALLSDGKPLKSTAELYVWVLYLILKEHVEKEGPSEKLVPEVFREYSSELKELCQICHELLIENRINFEGDVKSRLLERFQHGEFLEGLFLDVSDNVTKQFQFKHLTLLEFLAAVHICHMENRMEIIGNNVKNEFYQVVFFSCQLIAGCKYDGIIKQMFVNDEELYAINVEQLLSSVLKVVHNKDLRVKDYKQDEQRKQLFHLSLDIIMCFINKDVTNKMFIILTVKTLRCEMNAFNEESMRKVGEICDYLVDEFHCEEEELKEAFENVHVKWVRIDDDVKSINYVKHLKNVEGIRCWRMKSNIISIQKQVSEIPNCKRVQINYCELSDGEVVGDGGLDEHELEWLEIDGCKLNKISFTNVCNWAIASVKELELLVIENIEESWWKELIDAIANANETKNGCLALMNLEIIRCTQNMSEEMQMKVRRFTNYLFVMLIHNYSSL